MARSILAVVPDHVMTVGIFRGHRANEVLDITGALGLTAAQLHGDEPPEFTALIAAKVQTVIKVVTAGSAAVRSMGLHAAEIVMVDAAPRKKDSKAIARFVAEARATTPEMQVPSSVGSLETSGLALDGRSRG